MISFIWYFFDQHVDYECEIRYESYVFMLWFDPKGEERKRNETGKTNQ